MKLRRLRRLFSFTKNSSSKKGVRRTKKDFIYPYSNDIQLKREELWQNLQKGVLLEDKGILVPWLFPFAELTGIAEQRRERADRTELSLGKCSVFDGYEARLEAMRWKYKSEDELIKQVTENLGLDDEGERRFNYLREYLGNLLGEPTKTELEKFGPSDIGLICWQKGAIAISLMGIEHFNLRYTLSIGIKMPNAY